MTADAFALSIVIPTRNRCDVLRAALDSLIPEVGHGAQAEIIVIDNGSTDATQDVVAAFAAHSPCPVIYRYEPCPGLHVGRHLGAEVSRGPLLAYLDDDVVVQPGWLRAVIDRFASDPTIALVGGPCRPLWEVSPPSWLDAFRHEFLGGWYISDLSLLDFGNDAKDIPPGYVFGCNYCVRKDVLYAMGGFHPDGVPDYLLKFRGDGENGLSTKISRAGLRIVYDPGVSVGHRVPAARLTERYFTHIARRNGVSTAYSMFRRTRGFDPAVVARGVRSLFVGCLRLIKNRFFESDRAARMRKALLFRQQLAFDFFLLRHYGHIARDFRLKTWVLRESYFDIHDAPYDSSSRS